MSAKHTPGPWVIASEVRGVGAIYNIVKRGGLDNAGNPLRSHVATIFPDVLCDEHAPDVVESVYANVRLIAAAPELLAACEMAASIDCYKDHRDNPDMTEQDCIQCMARAAIAKAKGVEG